MAAIFPNPLSNDAVDKFNHKWMVMLLLVLSLASFIVPLHPNYQNQTEEMTSVTPLQSETTTSKTPDVQVRCWTPSQFTIAHIGYANAYCGNSFKAVLRGENVSNVFKIFDPDIHMPVAEQALSLSESLKPYFQMIRQNEERDTNREIQNEERDTNREVRVQKLVTFQTPVMLFVAAICLVLPQVVWSFLSECCSPFNVGQTLESAKQASAMDASSRNQFYEDMSVSVANSVRSSSRTASALYVTKKVLAVLVVLALLLVVTQYALPEVDGLDKDSDSTTPTKSNPVKTPSPNTPPDVMDFLKADVFLCDAGIRMFTNIQRYTFQCTLIVTEQNDAAKTTFIKRSPSKKSTDDKNLLEFVTVMYKIVTAILAILFVGNVFSLIAWVTKLMLASSKTSIGLTNDTATDILFLVQMARLNTSVDVTHRLAQIFTGFEKVGAVEMADE